MLLSHRLTHSRISAFIALLAIGLLFIAPDISKILEQQRMSAWDGMRMGMHEMTMPQHDDGATGGSGLASDLSAITGNRSRHHASGSATPDNAAAANHPPPGHRHHSETPGLRSTALAHKGHTTSATETAAGIATDLTAGATHHHPHGAAPHAPPVAYGHATPASSSAPLNRSATAHGDREEMRAMGSMAGMDDIPANHSRGDISTMGAMTGMDHSSMGGMNKFSCGYCELLVHLPMLVWIFIPLLWLILLSSRLPPPLTLPAFPLCWFPGTSQPRAPPHA